MSYVRHILPEDLQEARKALERLANALAAPEDAETLASIIQTLQDNQEAAVCLLECMLHRDARTIS